MSHGPVNGPDGPIAAFQSSVVASAMKWEDDDGHVQVGKVVKELDTEGAYIASTIAVAVESFR